MPIPRRVSGPNDAAPVAFELQASKIEAVGRSSENEGEPQSVLPWYVAYTRPQQESVALLNLRQQGFRAYLPLCKAYGKHSASLEPMFRRYVFFGPCRESQSIATARSTRGVNSIVTFGTNLAVVQPLVLHAIRALEQEHNAPNSAALSPFQPGHRARLRAPALNGLEGLVHAVSSKRVTLLLEILGRQKLLKVQHGQLELV